MTDSIQEKEFAWGVREIGEVINRTTRQTQHLLDKKSISSAQKKGGVWVAHREALRREFGAVQSD